MMIKRIIFFSIGFLLFLSNFLFGLEIVDNPDMLSSFSMESYNRIYSNKISGNDEQSFLMPGTNYELNYYFSQKNQFKEIPLIIDYEMNIRATDDNKLDHQKWHILDLYTKIEYADSFLFEFGDIYSNFSKYTLSYNLEGVQTEIKVKPTEKTQIGSKIVAARTGRPIERNRYERFVFGTRGYFQFDKYLEFGINMSRNWDDTNSIDDYYLDTDSLSPDKNNVYSMDLCLKNIDLWMFKNLFFESELAYGWFDDNVKKHAITPKKDFAYSMALNGSIEKLFFDVSYERVNPNFYTNLGSAPTDQQLFQINGTYRFFRSIRTRGGILYYRNGLNNSKNARQWTYIPKASILFYNIPYLENLEWEIGWRGRHSDVSGQGSRRERDRYTSSLNYYIKNMFLGYEAEIENDKDYEDKRKNTYIHGLSFGLHRQKLSSWLNFTLNNSVSFNIEDVPEQREDNYFNSFRSNVKFFIIEKFTFTSDFFYNDSDLGIENSDSIRKGWTLSLNYDPQVSEQYNMDFGIRFENKKNDYEDSSKDYDEKTLELTFNLLF